MRLGRFEICEEDGPAVVVMAMVVLGVVGVVATTITGYLRDRQQVEILQACVRTHPPEACSVLIPK